MLCSHTLHTAHSEWAPEETPSVLPALPLQLLLQATAVGEILEAWEIMGGKEGGREGGREGGMKGGREGGREGGKGKRKEKEGGREGGR